MKEAATTLNLAQMLTLSQLQTSVKVAELKDHPGVLPLTASCYVAGIPGGTAAPANQLAADWAAATTKARQLATTAGVDFDAMAQVSAYQFHGDFHRTVYAGELALRDMGEARVKQYRLLMNAFPANPMALSLIHISEPTRHSLISYAVFCLKKKK